MKTLLTLLIPTVLAAQQPVAVIDGDTIEAVTTEERIRLYGIDTPEFNHRNPAKTQAYGQAAADKLYELMHNGDFGIERVEKGKYGRTIAILRYTDKSQGTTVQAGLVRSGMAWVYDQYCDRPECDSWRRLERIAREQRRGLWADDNPMPPWEWRRR